MAHANQQQYGNNSGTLNAERISRVETSIEGLHAELSDIRSTLKSISELVSRGRETNWSLVLAGIALVGSLYASAIRPLEQETIRQQNYQGDLAKAVLVQNEKTGAVANEVSKLQIQLATAQQSLAEIIAHGTPDIDRRLTLLEFQMQSAKK